ncbi:hypothetical protein TD95_002333 [Thielaviopsis punctulata]|uniref:Pre-mRNA-processing protein prp40 n=1 Tax=Thielaviopsis punctulata TaxID=72032 RepID=A0A0F4ZGA8_9PEZI|nr:hypothetical protein TD95_002333 [Thielaviopsis punctulata]
MSAAGSWQAHTSAEGRTYYHNAVTGVTQWEKPEDLMTPSERALANQPWKEYTADGGRKYWYNTETKQSSWEMPEVYKRALGVQASSIPANPYAGGGFASASNRDNRDYRDRDRDRDRDHRDRDRDRDYRDRDRDRDRDRNERDFHRDNRGERDSYRPGAHNLDSMPPVFVPTTADPEFASPEEAEAAFVKLLKRSGVQSDWTWEQAIRATAKDPHYRAIRDPRDRKAAFEKYCEDVVEQDREKTKERMAKLRSDFETMLKSHSEIKHYTRWKTARAMIEGETIFRSTNNEEERRQLFIEYVIGLKKAYVENQAVLRKSGMDGLVELLGQLDLEPYTRWADAQKKIMATPSMQSDDKFQALSKFDILTAFQTHVKALERSFNESKQLNKAKKYRTERKNRDAFCALLTDLRKDGKITAATKWSQIFPLIEKDDRYLAMAGQAGSTAQELFWDVVEDEEKALRGVRNAILDVLDDKKFEVTSKTTFDEFQAVVRENKRVADTNLENLALLFERLQEKKLKRSEDERFPERLQRKAAENFKAYLRRLDPPISATDTYEKVKPRISRSEEFQFLYSDETRRSIFEKVQRRNKDRDDEDRDRQQRRRGATGADRASSDRDLYRERERDRSRGERSHRSGIGSGRRRSRSPTASASAEADPYEADRRKAIAERERNNSRRNAESLLDSAAPASSRDRDRDRLRSRDRERERDRDRERERERDRDRDRERDRERDRGVDRERERDRERDRDREYNRHRSRRDDDGYYERDRHLRDDDHVYLRRDRGGSYDELNYDDERPVVRRRRNEDEEDRRESKRSPAPESATAGDSSGQRQKSPAAAPATSIPAAVPAAAVSPAPSATDVPAADATAAKAMENTGDAAAKTNGTGKKSAGAKKTDEDVAMNSGSEEGEIEE